MLGSFLTCHLIILSLLTPVQRMPLQTQDNEAMAARQQSITHHLPQDLVNGSTFLESALFDDIRSLLLHEEHESIQWFLDVWLFLFHVLRYHSPRIRLHCRIRSHRLPKCSKLRHDH